MAIDPVYIVGALFVAGAAITYYFKVRPDGLTKIKAYVLEADAWIDNHKGEVPLEFKPMLDDVEQFIHDFKKALEDDKITYTELKEMGLDALALFEELKQIVIKK
jgi:hypothetical protein